MHLCSLYHGSEDVEAYKLGEARLIAYLLQSQMAQLLHECSTCYQHKRYLRHTQIYYRV